MSFSESVQRRDAHRSLEIRYTVDTQALVNLEPEDLNNWLDLHNQSDRHGLDTLYDVAGLDNLVTP